MSKQDADSPAMRDETADAATPAFVGSVESALAKYWRESEEFFGGSETGDKIARKVGETLRQFRGALR